jgi:hypothetical protein
MYSSDNVWHNAGVITYSNSCPVWSMSLVPSAAEVTQAKWNKTHLLLFFHSVLVSDQVHIEILDKGVVAARLVTNHSQQLKEGLHPVPVVADVVEVALGNAASLQQLVALKVLLLCNPENSSHSILPSVELLGQLLAVTRSCIAYASESFAVQGVALITPQAALQITAKHE